MFSKLELKLAGDTEISYQMASTFHGALMELLPGEYAEELHESRLHPYTQHLEKRTDGWYWVVTGLNEQASSTILQDSLLHAEGIYLKRHNAQLAFEKKNYEELTEKELAREFYDGKNNRYIAIQFLTPTAFKLNGRYLNYPDFQSLFANLMNKYDSASEQESMRDEETLEQLVQNTILTRYQLRSTLFSLEGVRIPAFMGDMTIRISGTQTMCSFANMLFRFGEYAGVGIKTALGMGAIRLQREDREGKDGR